jgi:hypothetical protein
MLFHKGLQVATGKEVALQARGPRSLEIARPVADQDAVIRVDRETAEQVRDHPGRACADAHATISLDSTFRVIRAVPECVDMGPQLKPFHRPSSGSRPERRSLRRNPFRRPIDC